MDRQIVYVGSVPTDTDQLLQSRNTLVGLGYLAQAVFGNAHAYVDGLACTPGTGLNVLIGPGSLMTPSVVDADYYGTLPPSSDPVVKLAINTTVTTLAVPAAGATWCVAAVFSEQQGGATVLPYFNATNPGQTMFGVDGQGGAQATVLQQRVALSMVSGTVAPAGAIALWTITVPAGTTVIDASMIQPAPGAPFLSLKLPAAAPLASPIFTGTPQAPTPPPGDLSGRLATTQFLTGYVNRTGDIMSGSLGVPLVYQMANNLAVQDPVANVITGSIYTPGHLTMFNVGSSVATLGISRQSNGSPIVSFTSSTDEGATLNVGSISLVVTNGIASGVNYNTASDYRLKEDVEPLCGLGARRRLGRLRPVSYIWRGSVGEERTVGFIAHEFGAVYPSALVGEKDAVDERGAVVPQMIDQTRVIPDLVAALGEMSRRLAALEARLGETGRSAGTQP